MARRDYSPYTARGPRNTRTPLGIALLVLIAGYGMSCVRQQQSAPRREPGAAPSGGAPEARAPAAPPERSGVSAVGSFNIKWFGTDGPEPRNEEDIRAVAEVIQATGAPLLGLQEIGDDEMMERLLRYLPGYRYVLGTTGRGQRCAILWDSARASVSRAREWPDVNRDLERSAGTLRAPLVAPARVGDFDFLFVVVHLKAMFDERSVGMRRTQAERLRARLDEWLAENPDKDVLVVGDFNDHPGSATLAPITRQRQGYGFVNAGARLPSTAVTHFSPAGRIDHIMITSPAVATEEWTGKAFVYAKPRGAARKRYDRSVSDHLPTWATFRTDRDNDP